MKIFTLATLDSEPSDPNTFVGRARLTRMSDAAAHPQTNVYRVAFEAGARTNWHSHTGPQLLQIVDGTCRFQKDGEPVREAAVGDLISIEPGERHWHGAAPGGPMTHVAVNIDATTSWYAPVTEKEYVGQAQSG
ncbi:MAG: cupin domain-containing protein [Acidobacteria bacterium]|nr:cupin domain-containing protein [Acidobacteriota bacterium]